MNIVIVGCGKVGEKLTEMLCLEENLNITVVDIKSNVVDETVNNYDVMGVVGSGTSLDILKEAGVEKADVLIAVTGFDELNLMTCLIAKKMGGCQTIARVRNPEYGKELHLFKEDLGLAMIINPEQAAANEIARALRFPSAIHIDTFAKGRVEILKVNIPEGCVLHNMSVSDIFQKLECDVLVCGVERDNTAYIPDGGFVLREGDMISIVAAPTNGSHFFKKIGIKTNRVKDCMIVGGSSIAVYLTRRLLQTGISVKLIERDKNKSEFLSSLIPKATIINGDGTDNDLLLEEGIENAESFVALTNIDEENILLSLFARSKTKGKLVTKINRIAYDEVISHLDLDTVIYPKNITAEYIVRFVRAMRNSINSSNIETIHFILDGKAEALEFKINENSPISGVPICDLVLKKNILIACVNRRGQIIIPRGRDIIYAGDTVIIVTKSAGINDISDILEK